MPQNIYDDASFFEGYRQLPRSSGGLAEAPEWRAVEALIPNLEGARILDLGCGFGAFDRWAIEQGAAEVVAIDLSRRMLAEARQRTSTDKILYLQGDVSRLDDLSGTFDLIYSALAFHYIENFSRLCGDMRQRLRVGGSLVATVEHPVYTAPSSLTWTERGDGGPVWPLDNYFVEGQRVRHWIAAGVIKYHRTLSTYLDCLLCNGFMLRKLVEWAPTREQLDAHPEWSGEIHRPMFLIIRADAVASHK